MIQYFRACFIVLLINVSLVNVNRGDSIFAAEPTGQKVPVVRTESVGVLTASQPKQYVGIVTAKEAVTLVPRISGFLKKVAFQEGSVVKKGDLLFEIEDTVYQMNVKVAESVVRQIEAEIALAQRDLERSSTLHTNRVITDQELDQARRTINLQEAKRDEAKAKLSLAENDLSYTKIVAPLTGRIGAKQLSEGNYITPGSGALATIVQYDPISVKFTLSETDYMTYFQGAGEKSNELAQDAQIDIFRVDGKPFDEKFRVDFFDNLVDRQTGTVAVYLICDNADSHLLPGGYAKIKLSKKYPKPVPAVSAGAVLINGTSNYVYVLTPENKAVRRNVALGALVFDKYIIAEGLSPEEQVIVGGVNKISDNMIVQPVSHTK